MVEKAKVLVVDDSVFMQKLISNMIEEDDALQVIATARNGAEAVELVKRLRPDVVTLDIEMPEMNGLEALQQIMRECPTRVLMLSSMTQQGAEATVTALQYGAIDFIAKPSGSITKDLVRMKQELIAKMKLAMQTAPKAKPGWSGSNAMEQSSAARQHVVPQPSTRFREIVAIGTSTGGPRALDQVISSLPADFPAPVLIVQHMPPKFTKSLAERLHRSSALRVVEAEDGQIIESGCAYIAPGNYHMIAEESGAEYRIRLHQEPPCSGHRPSVDVLFDSVAKLDRLKQYYVLMTGMGGDGAQGMMRAKERAGERCVTIAESEETCIVYGMPRSAVELGCVDLVLPVTQIAEKLTTLVDK